MRLFFVLLIICACWLVFAQSCMRFRTSDSTAITTFKEKNIPFKTASLHFGNRTMHYVESGNDTLPTIVFIHGSPGSWDAFEQYMKDSLLLLHYRMVSIDRPGFGYSDFGEALNLDAQCKLLHATIQHIENNKPICLVGHSLGGPVVVKLAADFPDLPVSNLVILAGSVDPSEEAPENWRSTLDRTPLRYFIPGAMRPSNAELLLFKQDVNELPAALSNVKCKVLLMQGDSDMLVPPGNSVFAQKQLTKAKEVKLVWFKGENHFIPWTRFTDIRNALLNLDINQ